MTIKETQVVAKMDQDWQTLVDTYLSSDSECITDIGVILMGSEDIEVTRSMITNASGEYLEFIRCCASLGLMEVRRMANQQKGGTS